MPPITEIELYADGSYSEETGMGAWAFRVPWLGLEGAGAGTGRTNGRFEVLAVLHGLEAIIAAGPSGNQLHKLACEHDEVERCLLTLEEKISYAKLRIAALATALEGVERAEHVHPIGTSAARERLPVIPIVQLGEEDVADASTGPKPEELPWDCAVVGDDWAVADGGYGVVDTDCVRVG